MAKIKASKLLEVKHHLYNAMWQLMDYRLSGLLIDIIPEGNTIELCMSFPNIGDGYLFRASFKNNEFDRMDSQELAADLLAYVAEKLNEYVEVKIFNEDKDG